MTKDTTFKLRLSTQDRQILQGKADAAGISAAQLILKLVREADIPGYVPTPVDQLAGQISFDDLGGFGQ